MQLLPLGTVADWLATAQAPVPAADSDPAALVNEPPLTEAEDTITSLVPELERLKATTPPLMVIVAPVMLSCSTFVYVNVRAPNQAATAIAMATVTATRMMVAMTGLRALVLRSRVCVFNRFDPFNM